MEQIALIIGENYIYWSAVIRVMAAAAAICAFLALYLRTGKSPVAALAGIPLAIISSLVLSRMASWYFHPEGTLEAALDFGNPGGFALMGVFAGCFLTAAFLRLVKLTDNLPQLLDCMAVSGALGIATGRLSSAFNASARGLILPETVGFPWATVVQNPVSGMPEHRLATFLLQAMAAGLIFVILLLFTAGKREKKDGDACLLFLLFYGASQAVLDSTRYDSLHFRSNGFIGAVQVLSAAAMALCVILFAIRMVRAGGWKKWHGVLWLFQAACFGLAGYMEYYVQRHGHEAEVAYSIMGIALLGIILSALVTRSRAAVEERNHDAWLLRIRRFQKEDA